MSVPGPDHPFGDTPVRALSRFVVEVLAWVLGPWAVANGVGWGAAWVTLVVLVAVPAMFSTEGDKQHTVVATPGPVRVVLEVVLFGVAAVAPHWVMSPSTAALTSVVVAFAAVLQAPRWARLARDG